MNNFKILQYLVRNCGAKHDTDYIGWMGGVWEDTCKYYFAPFIVFNKTCTIDVCAYCAVFSLVTSTSFLLSSVHLLMLMDIFVTKDALSQILFHTYIFVAQFYI